MKTKYFENGLTVRELKELIKDWPEVNYCGEECEVWIADRSGLSNAVKEVSPLNLRENEGILAADIIFEP